MLLMMMMMMMMMMMVVMTMMMTMRTILFSTRAHSACSVGRRPALPRGRVRAALSSTHVYETLKPRQLRDDVFLLQIGFWHS